jgi:hypothetical protein
VCHLKTYLQLMPQLSTYFRIVDSEGEKEEGVVVFDDYDGGGSSRMSSS